MPDEQPVIQNRDDEGSSNDTLQSSRLKPKFLKLRLFSAEKERYAVVPLPQTYQGAVTLAVEIFGNYLTDLTPDSIKIRCAVRDKMGSWIWADIMPRDWQTVTEEFNHEFGVFHHPKPLMPEHEFQRGSIFVSYGTTNGHETEWTTVTSSRIIDRPKSYGEAVNYIKSLIRRDTRKGTRWGGESFPSFDLDDKSFLFYEFTIERGNESSTGCWRILPPSTRTNDDVWRVMVPAPGKILGFKIKVI